MKYLRCGWTSFLWFRDICYGFPKETMYFVRLTYGEAFEYGQNKIEAGEWTGFNIGQNIGIDAGQTILWPHIHLIPRHPSDRKDKGGIRRAIPNGDHKAYY
jgi:hypothetical protein